MIDINPLDKNVPIFEQLNAKQSPVVLLNIFNVAEEEGPALIKAWKNDANWMKKQPGYISSQLHKAIAGSTVFMNYAVWDSVEDFKNAFTHPEFQEKLKAYPCSAITSPHLFGKIAIPNICNG